MLLPRRRRLAGAEHGSRVLQIALNVHCERVCATEHAPRGPFHVLERRHSLAEIIERGAVVPVERHRVNPPPTMACGAAKTCAHRVLNLETGEVENPVANFSAMDNVMPSHMNKHVPLPKVMVPVGKDVEGKPVALQFMGRAGPVGASDLAYAFDDEILRGLDVPFLRDVDVLVEAMVAEDPSLARVAPEMVTRDLLAA